MVTSTGSGLAVPDWPLSYGMLFPPMVGGVFYEHGHRMVATTVGFLTLILAVFLYWKERRLWVKKLGYAAFIAVILQGLLGGLTVKLFLPPPVSIFHGVLAQTFFLLTILIAYSQSCERQQRSQGDLPCEALLIKMSAITFSVIYLQLMIGAVMRHTQSGLAIPDFPTMGGKTWPTFDSRMLSSINDWRFAANLEPVVMKQVFIHFLHRVTALMILIFIVTLNYLGTVRFNSPTRVKHSLFWLSVIVWVQIILGILTVLNVKSPVITSLHVVTGAATLAASFLLVLRTSPLSLAKFRESFA